MNELIEAAKAFIEDIEGQRLALFSVRYKAYQALRAAVEKFEKENRIKDIPAAWLAVGDGKVGLRAYLHKENALDHTHNIEPLYLHPHQPVLLTEEEIGTLYGQSMNVIINPGVSRNTFTRIVRKAEEKILSKNFDK